MLEMPNPKPIKLLKRLLSLVITPNKSQIVLDFFSGSASFAHAALDYMAENENIRFNYICVQIPQEISVDGNGFKSNK